MPDEPNTGILDRTLFRTQIGKFFADQLALLEQVVNYGTNLVPRCFNSSDRGVADTVAVVSFLKHAVTSLDAIYILAREGAALSCFPHIRSLFEIDLYLRWIFQEDFERRGSAYFVWNIRKKRYWLRCYLDGTPEQAAHTAHMEGSPGEDTVIPHTQEEIQNAIDLENSRLDAPEVAGVNALFEPLMATSGKDVEWYRPFGVNSIRDMAIRLGDEGMYKVFYAQYSQATHGLSLEQQLHFNATEREVVFDHIRTLQSVDEIFRMTFNFAFKIYRTMLEKYRPGELDAFRRKYLEEWRARFRAIPKVTKDGSSFTISPPQTRRSSGCYQQATRRESKT